MSKHTADADPRHSVTEPERGGGEYRRVIGVAMTIGDSPRDDICIHLSVRRTSTRRCIYDGGDNGDAVWPAYTPISVLRHSATLARIAYALAWRRAALCRVTNSSVVTSDLAAVFC